MTVTLLSDFTGGSAGAAITTGTEPNFTAAAGTPVYGPAIGGYAGGSLEVTTTGDVTVSLGGRTHARIGYPVMRVTGTQSATCYLAAYYANTTLRGNAVLHNTTNPGKLSFRNGTTIGATSANSMASGDCWWVEVEYTAGVSYKIHIWYTLPAAGAPNETFTIATADTSDRFRLGNVGTPTSLTMRYGPVSISDGEQIAPPGPGTLTFASNAWASASELVVTAKLDAAVTARIEATPSGGGTTLVGSEIAPTDNYARLSVSGLAANTAYNWTIYVDNTSRKTGTITTLPAAGGATGFTFGWGSCFDTYTSGVFDLIAARNPAFFGMVGDWGYQYITGGTNGNTSPTDQATVRTHREAVLTAAIPQAFFTGRPISYTYSDCDGAGANSDSTTGGHATGAVQAAYRQQFAHPTLPLTNSGARSWVIGRVRFIQTDETVQASAKGNTDNSSKTKLGAEQKTWFKAQIDAAVAAGQVVVWLGDGPWIESTSLTGNSWRAYNTERTELGTYIVSSGVKLIRLHGDTHTLFYDDGTNNPWGGFPTASAAPMHTTGQAFGQTVSGGKWPTTTTNSSRQYGIGTVTDNGTQISITVKGWSSTAAAPSEVERFSGTVVVDTTTAPPADGYTPRDSSPGYGRTGILARTLTTTYGRA